MKKLLLTLLCLPMIGFGQMLLENTNKRNTFQNLQQYFENWSKENDIIQDKRISEFTA